MKYSSHNFNIRNLLPNDLSAAHAMTLDLKWPHRLEDWQQIVSLGPSLVMEDAGKVIGTACLVPQGKFASVGLVVIANEYQGRGLGRRMMEAVMDIVTPGTNLYLTATVMGKPLYEKLGFVDYRVIEQYQTTVNVEQLRLVTVDNLELRDLTTTDISVLKRLMNVAMDMNRDDISELMVKESSSIKVLESEGLVKGFACYRPFGRGFAIGPVVAESETNALALISELLHCADGQFVRLDIDAYSLEIASYLSECGFDKVDTVSQMVKGQLPDISSSYRQYCLFTQAIG
ncbi:GNAT family N-acetyltransferase [Vibrio viridaestus]|nr:GNAT family N-acetyltransferase [Vibrio viridaestus]